MFLFCIYLQIVNIIGWLLSIALMIVTIFANYPLQQFDTKAIPFEFGLYDAFSRIGWSMALFYIIFACVHNSGGPVNWFLSHPLWLPISRLCYATYLLHVPIIVMMYATTKSAPVFSQTATLQDFIIVYILTLLASTVATLTFESPIIIFEKILFKTTTESEKNNISVANESEKQKLM